MKACLVQEIRTFRVESDLEAEALIKDFRDKQYANGYKLTNSSSKYKNKKIKGEIVDEWYLVSVTLDYDKE